LGALGAQSCRVECAFWTAANRSDAQILIQSIRQKID
jgi:hypothetical protein